MNRREFARRVMGGAIAGWTPLAGAQRAAHSVSFTEEPGKVHVAIAGSPFTTFHYGDQWDKPFLHPIRRASGRAVTRGFPLEKIEGESNDHGWHRGLWYAHGDVNGVDFWRELGRNKTGRLVLKSAPKHQTTRAGGSLVADVEMVGPDGKTQGSMRQRFDFSRAGENNIVDAYIIIRADRRIPVKMGDTEEGALGFRFADEFREDRGATLMNSEGLVGTRNIWGKRAKWVDYSTTLKGQPAGVAIFDHPKNPKHPTYWHARGYGLNSANPFGEHDFHKDKTRDGSVTIPDGGKLEFGYRVLIHPGDAKAAGVERLYAEYAQQG